MPIVDKDGYECRGCRIPVSPASYQPHNKVRPYFTPGKTPHKKGCDVDGEEELIGRAKKGSVSDHLHGFPSAYPDRLELHDTREVASSDMETSERKQVGGSSKTKGDEPERTYPSRWAAKTIRPICKTFINYPYDRNILLKIAGLDGSTYKQIFSEIKGAIRQLPKGKLFYAPLYWTRAIENEDFFEKQLWAGNWEKTENNNKNKLVKSYRLRVLWNGWSAQKKNLIRKEMDFAEKEAQEAYKEGRKEKAWLFFIGQQDDSDLSLLTVDDHRLVCCLASETISLN